MYNIRDLFGHFVRLPPRSNDQGPCPHACCGGRRPHPERLPVMLDRATLRRLSDQDLEAHFRRERVGANGRAVSQVVRELERRERATEAKAHRATHRANREEEYRLYLHHEWTTAEVATRGTMVNKAGRAKGVDERAFWTSARLRDRYASDELRAWFDRHPPVSRREFLGGHDTQARAAQSHRERRMYGVY